MAACIFVHKSTKETHGVFFFFLHWPSVSPLLTWHHFGRWPRAGHWATTQGGTLSYPTLASPGQWSTSTSGEWRLEAVPTKSLKNEVEEGGTVLFNDALKHILFMVIWHRTYGLRTILIVRKETRCRHIDYSFRLAARVLLYAPSHRQDSTYHSLCYTSRGALAGTRNSSMCQLHEGSIRRSIAPWANALTTELWKYKKVY